MSMPTSLTTGVAIGVAIGRTVDVAVIRAVIRAVVPAAVAERERLRAIDGAGLEDSDTSDTHRPLVGKGVGRW